MTRPKAFFEIASGACLPNEAALRVGDVLRIDAMGAVVHGGSDAIQIVGPLTSSTLTPLGTITPAGGPNVVIVVARKPGKARLDVIFGSPWGSRKTQEVSVIIEP